MGQKWILSERTGLLLYDAGYVLAWCARCGGPLSNLRMTQGLEKAFRECGLGMQMHGRAIVGGNQRVETGKFYFHSLSRVADIFGLSFTKDLTPWTPKFMRRGLL